MFVGIISAVFGFVEALLALRFVFRLIGADPSNMFVNWVYDWSTPLAAPFAGIFGQDATVLSGQGVVAQSVFDWTALIALVVYGLLAGILIRLLGGHK